MQSDQKTIFCEKCQKQINAPNYIIHEAMCKGNRESFILGGLNKLKSKQSREEFNKGSTIQEYPQLEEEKHQQKQKQKQKQKQEEKRQQPQKREKQQYPALFQPEKKYNPNLNNTKVSPEQKPQIPKSTTPPKTKPNVVPKKQTNPPPEQRFRCTDCGYMMTMKQLDSHPNECPARHKRCQYCNLQFPHYLMQMHSEVCQKQPNRRQPRRPSNEREHIRQELNRRREEDQTERNRVQPRGTREGNIPPGIIPVQSQTFVRRQGNDRVIIRRVRDQNGRVYEQRYRQPLQQQRQQSDEQGGYTIIVPISMGNGGTAFINMQDMFSGSGGFEQIIRRLMTNMNINRQQNPGLTKEQMKKIPIIKYDPDSNPKSTSCTICVTDFEKGVEVMKLPCGHLFNPQCLVPWLKNSAVCPNCRGKVKPQ